MRMNPKLSETLSRSARHHMRIAQRIIALVIALIALQIYETPASQECENARDLYRQGTKLLNLEERRDAFAKAVELCPTYAEAHINLADAHEKLGDFELAEKHYRQAVALGLQSPIPYIGLGEVCLKTGRYKLAVESYQKGIEIDPGNERLHAGLKVSTERINRERTFFTTDQMRNCLTEDEQFRLMCMCPVDHYSALRKWICMPVILFSPGSGVLSGDAARQLDAVGDVLNSKELAGRQWLIIGHADSTGERTLNLKLSRNRAERVRRYLVERCAIDPNRLRILSLGQDQPRGANTTLEGRAENRRVEIVAENL